MAVLRSRIDRAGESHVEVLETMAYWDWKITGQDLGYVINNTL